VEADEVPCRVEFETLRSKFGVYADEDHCYMNTIENRPPEDDSTRVRTYTKGAHGSPLSVYLIYIRQSSGESIGCNFVAVFVSKLSRLCTGTGDLCTGVGYRDVETQVVRDNLKDGKSGLTNETCHNTANGGCNTEQV
jgi:hypothetical protein